MAFNKSENYLVISDLQIPFEAERALQFCLEIKRDFNISNENILNVGDEVDEYFGSLFDRDPDADLSAIQEIKQSREKIRKWGNAFPHMRIAESNHGMRWAKKAFKAGIPSIMLRKYQEIIEAPEGWQWKREWIIKAKHPFLMMHGMGYSGMYAHRQMAVNNGISTVHGHLHANAGVAHIKTVGIQIWGMNTGCLIDPEAFAFQYGKDSKFKPSVGVGVVLDNGRTPIWLPYPY